MTEHSATPNDADKSQAVVTALRDALKEVKRLRADNTELAAAAHRVPIAITGLACRFPGGADSPDEFFQLLLDGVDAIGGFPTDRGWDLDSIIAPEGRDGPHSYVDSGGFLSDASGFDAAFFGISPREAAAMDPQQRLLLESTWEALESAGVDPTTLRGKRVGVYVGTNGQDYLDVLTAAPAESSGYVGTGSAASVLSGRIAYCFGFIGPVVTVDTACSASLVALDQARTALAAGDCDLAVVAGVTVMTTPRAFIDFSAQRGLAPDGRCKPFAADADGTAWGEGIATVVLQRVPDVAAGRVRAVVRGSAVNSDGTSSGLTAPSGSSQQRVIRAALADAGLRPDQVDVIEAHGTGTALGDPVEAGALLATYGVDRPTDRPVLLGSVKSNIGHTQAAAGLAGVVKLVVAMKRGLVPASLHCDEPTSMVDWSTGALRVNTATTSWPAGSVRRAAVSSFGFSGTNAHVVLEHEVVDIAAESDGAAASPVVALPLSAKNDRSLRAGAAALLSMLSATPTPREIESVAQALASNRAVFDHRAVVTARTDDGGASVRTGLRAVAESVADPFVVAGAAGSGAVTMMFTGQGAARLGMGRELYDAFAVFAAALDEAFAVLDPLLQRPLREVMWAEPGAENEQRLDQTAWTQPALFAMHVALYRLAESFGVRPDALLGHSVGEIAVAHVAGIFSLADAAALVVARGKLMQALPAGGGMWSVRATESVVAPQLPPELTVAAVNTPDSVVISGSIAAAEPVVERWRAEGRTVTALRVSHAFHSPLMNPILDELRAVAAALTARPATVPVISTVTGAVVAPDTLSDPEYWVRQVGATVRFSDAVLTAVTENGAATLLELGPGGVLTALATQTLADRPDAALAVPALRKDRAEVSTVIAALTASWARGGTFDFAESTGPAAPIDLPTYPFDRQRHWLDTGARTTTDRDTALRDAGQAPLRHPLLSAAVTVADPELILTTGRCAVLAQPWLADHVVGTVPIVPGTALLDAVLTSARYAGCDELTELTLRSPVAVLPDEPREIQVVIGAPDERGGRPVLVATRADTEGADWDTHATGTVRHRTVPVPEPDATGAPFPPPGFESVDLAGHYEDLGDAGLHYGPAFRALRAAWTRDGVVAVLVDGSGSAFDGTSLNPALLDAALHAVGFSSALPDGELGRIPFMFSGVRLHTAGIVGPWRVILTPTGPGAVALAVSDGAGNLLAEIDAVTLLAAEQVRRPISLYRREWIEIHSTPDDSVDSRVPAEILAIDHDDPGIATHTALAAVQRTLSLPETTLVVTADADTVAGAAVWGLIASAITENPGRFVLLDTDDFEPTWTAVHAAIAAGHHQLRWRAGKLQIPRVRRLPVATPDGSPAPDLAFGSGTVLVTGASGALAGLFARHLVREHGVMSLALVSRAGRGSAATVALAAELEQAGARVRIAACDVGDRAEVAALLDSIADLSAVVHLAGRTEDGVVAAMTPERVDAVFGPKIVAALHLHELTADRSLAAFVLFSSIAGTVGAAGQANYAAANAALDELARRRVAAGLPALSLAWGVWERGGGMTDALGDADKRRMRRTGLVPLTDAAGLALFDAALAAAEPAVVAAVFERGADASATPPILRDVVTVRRTAVAETVSTAGVLPTAMLTGEQLVALVRAEVGAVLALPADAPTDVAFRDLGFDSLLSLELRNRLATKLDRPLPPTLVFDYPNVIALAEHLDEQAAPAHAVAPAKVARRAAAEDRVAIVGMSCRFPGGVDDPDGLWQLVAQGREGITSFPAERGWDAAQLYDPDPAATGKTYCVEGGFLPGAELFDAEFFGISPREALTMDPQQRLLLESSWAAIEDAGLDPNGLRGSSTGVFVGMMYHDYGSRVRQPSAELEGYLANGSAGSVASGRVSYVLGLEGPSLTVDTACSSSLVTTHLAAASLRSGECDLALAGGVTVMSTPQTFVEFSRQRGLASDGRCKSFAAAADGTGWGEGVAVLVLERLADAEANGHQVLAVLAGSAVNSDGASNGLTAPNGPAQQRVIRAALAAADIAPTDVDLLEAHGTGTTLGDPIEAGALLATYGADRAETDPLWLGSLKSNIGHTQAAAGVAGIIKAVQAIRHGVLPKTLHVDASGPTDQVDWTAGGVRLLDHARTWPDTGGRPRRAAVSAFGISGTNAHVVLEQAPAEVRRDNTGEDPRSRVFPLSARTTPALAAQARVLGEWLEHRGDTDPADLAASLRARPVFAVRAAVVASDTAVLGDGLAAIAAGSPTALTGTMAELGRVAFVFSGQGSQRVGMGRVLYSAEPEFAACFDRVAAAVDEHTTWSVREAMWPTGDTGETGRELARTEFAQPALFTLEVALFDYLVGLGYTADLVCGHSVGEFAAAYAAGVLTLSDAAALVVARGALMAELCAPGTMYAITATEDDVRPALTDEVSLAAVNGIRACVISGPETAIERVAAALSDTGFRAKELVVSHGFHSPAMEPMLASFAAVVARVTLREPVVPFVSTVTGALAGGGVLTDPSYWVEQVRATVRYADATEVMFEQGVRTGIELGPAGVLSALAAGAAEEHGIDAVFTPVLRPPLDERTSLATATATLFARGARLPALAGDPATSPTRLGLPTYAFQGERYWLAANDGARDMRGVGLVAVDHPILGAVLRVAGADTTVLTGTLSTRTHPWLTDHRIGATIVVPGAALIESVLHAASAVGNDTVAELVSEMPLVLSADGETHVQIQLTPSAHSAENYTAVLYSATAEDPSAWTRHAVAELTVGTPLPDLPVLPDLFAEVWAVDDVTSDSGHHHPGSEGARSNGRAASESSADDVVTRMYRVLAERGLFYGPSFSGVRAIERRGGEVYAAVRLPEGVDARGYGIHPALLDACLHALSTTDTTSNTARIPFAWQGFRLLGTVGSQVVVVLSDLAGEGDFAEVGVRIVRPDGVTVGIVERLSTRPVEAAQFTAAEQRIVRVDWRPVQLPSADAAVLLRDRRVPESVDEKRSYAVELMPDVTVRDNVRWLLPFLRQWVETGGARLVVVGRAGVDRAGVAADPDVAACYGALRSVQTEFPDRIVVLDMAATAPETAVAEFSGTAAQGSEPELAVTDGELRAPRLIEVESASTATEFDPESTVLITGGTGTLGGIVANHLVVRHGVRRLLLTSRRGPDADGVDELVERLEAAGAEVDVVAADLTDRTAVLAVLDRLPRDRPLGAIVHTAGVHDDALLADQTPQRFDRVLAAKSDSARHLDELTADRPPAVFVLFSSVAGVLGGPGQANYAAANSYLDALAAKRRARGLPAQSIAWGAWAGGMAGALSAADLKRLAGAGMRPLSVAEGLAALDTAMSTREAVVVAANWVDATSWRGRAVPVKLRELIGIPSSDADPVESASLLDTLADMPPARRTERLLDAVRGEVASVLALPHARVVAPDRQFTEFGFDSLMAVELRNRLGALVGVRLPATAVFDYPTPRTLAELLTELVDATTGTAVQPAPDAVRHEPELATDLDELDTAGLIALALGGPTTGSAGEGLS
ncbi:SDR family NAD(P)-dependent oxidoreductase [Nocardia sp. NPDC060249]|uniref:SDR family NAD(P)-dependent oxidoreductase n=1 Tax=Nocardia sp. NPDC060249 TaxID=3347082 RepID=UPI0036650E7A